jgi:hypothetical protein
LNLLNAIKLIPVILSFLLLGAHFYRAGLVPLTVLSVAVLLLLFVKKSWVPRLFQVLLLAGALEWLRALYFLAAMRIAWDQPWTRLAIILGTVALLTALSGLVFNNRKLGQYYEAEKR